MSFSHVPGDERAFVQAREMTPPLPGGQQAGAGPCACCGASQGLTSVGASSPRHQPALTKPEQSIMPWQPLLLPNEIYCPVQTRVNYCQHLGVFICLPLPIGMLSVWIANLELS